MILNGGFMEEEITLEEYVENYNSQVYNTFPKLFRYMEYINDSAYNICWLGEQLFKEETTFDGYENNIGVSELINQAINILGMFSKDYKKLLEEIIKNGVINFYDATDETFSYTTFKNNYADVSIDRNYNVEDLLKIIHEFFHYVHIDNFNRTPGEEDCYIYTEFFALTAEMYAMFYMYKNNIYKNDIIIYLKKYIMILYSYANKTFIQGSVMHIYDICNDFSDEAINEYIKLTNTSEEIKNVLYLLDDIDDFDYHILAPYIIGVLPAFLLAKNMIDDKYSVERFKTCVENAKNYTEIDELFKLLNIENILQSTDEISNVIDDVYDIVKDFFEEKNINYQKKLGDL